MTRGFAGEGLGSNEIKNVVYKTIIQFVSMSVSKKKIES